MRRACATLAALLALCAPALASETPVLGSAGAVLVIGEAADVALRVPAPTERDAERALARFCGRLTRAQAAPLLEDREPGAPLLLPWDRLTPAIRAELFRDLFPADRCRGEYLVHEVTARPEESFSLLSRLLTGTDRLILDLFTALGREPAPGDLLRVHRTDLDPELAAALWAAPATPAPPRTSTPDAKADSARPEPGAAATAAAPATTPPAGTDAPAPGTATTADGRSPAPAPTPKADGRGPDRAATADAVATADPDEDLEGETEAAGVAPAPPPAPREIPLPEPRGGLTYHRDGPIAIHGELRVRRGDSLYKIAQRYTGRTRPERVNAAVRAIQRASGLKRASHIRPGQRIVIPGELLGGEYALPEALPAQSTCPGAIPAARGPLRYVRLPDGRVEAEYRLQQGEALYSAVVVRFTGRLRAKDVNGLALLIAEHNGIQDVTKIPTGARIRIPLELLDDAWHPCPTEGSGEAAVAVVVEEELPGAVAAPQAKAGTAAGLHFILDAGHGGRDGGATVGKLAEDEYAYDLVLRVKRHLEAAGGTVHMLLYDKVQKYAPRDQALLPIDRNEVLLTKPAWYPNSPKRAVMVRIALAHRIYRTLTKKQKVDPGKILFLSLHLDHLHSSVRGSFAYYPHHRMRRSSITLGGGPVRTHFTAAERRLTYPKKFRLASQHASRRLAYRIVRALKAAGFPITRQPVRYKIYRGRRVFSPAVVRHAPTSRALLLEAFNLGNARQRTRVQKFAQRELYARTLANALIADFNNKGTVKLPPAARDNTQPSWKKKKKTRRRRR